MTHTKVHTLQHLGKKKLLERSLGQTNLLILESLPEEKEARGAPLGTWTLTVATLGSSFYHVDTVVASATVESSLQLISTRTGATPAHQPVEASVGKPQIKQIVRRRHSSTHQQASFHKAP